jgi:hypothetical protein
MNSMHQLYHNIKSYVKILNENEYVLLSLQELRRNLFVIKKSSKQNLNKEITRHKDAVSKLDEAMKTIERLKSVIQVSIRMR